MCVPTYVKYMLVSVFIGVMVILSIFSNNMFYFLPIMIFSIIWSRFLCPKCKNPILKDKNGWYMFTMRRTCRSCGQDTLNCEIEPDSVTNARLK